MVGPIIQLQLVLYRRIHGLFLVSKSPLLLLDVYDSKSLNFKDTFHPSSLLSNLSLPM